jgi:hypothetical protein
LGFHNSPAKSGRDEYRKSTVLANSQSATGGLADWKRQFGTVASGILPDVEGGILPPGSADKSAAASKLSVRSEFASPFPAGRMPAATFPAIFFPKQPLQSHDDTVISVQTEIEEIWQH